MYDKTKAIEELKKTVFSKLKSACHENGISYLMTVAAKDDGRTTDWYCDGIPAGEIDGLTLSDDRVRRALLVLNGLDHLAADMNPDLHRTQPSYAYKSPAASEKVAEDPAADEKNSAGGDSIAPGRYRHFKGMEYEVLSMAKNSETEEDMVVYRALYGDGQIWVRPASMWNETVTWNGKECRRFTRISG